MEYMLLIHADNSGAEAVPESVRAQMLAAYRAYTEALQQAGVVRGGVDGIFLAQQGLKVAAPFGLIRHQDRDYALHSHAPVTILSLA